MTFLRWVLVALMPFAITAGYALTLGWLGSDGFIGLPIASLCVGLFCWAIWMPHLSPMHRCVVGFVGMSWATMLIVGLVPRLASPTWEREHLLVWTSIGAGVTGIFALAFLVGVGFARAVQSNTPDTKA